MTAFMLGAGETLFWSEALNDASRWEPAQIRHPATGKVFPVEKKSSNEFSYRALPNLNTILFEIRKNPGQMEELWASPAFPLQSVESLNEAESLSFELFLKEPAPEKLTQSAILLAGRGQETIMLPFELTQQGNFEKITVELPQKQNLEAYDRISLKLATNEDKIVWQWRNASIQGTNASALPRRSPIDTVLAVRPLSPCAMFFESEELGFNFVIPVEAHYAISNAYGKKVQTGVVKPGKNVLPKLPCGYYFLSLQAAGWEYCHSRNFCVVPDRVALPTGKESPYGMDLQIDAISPYFLWLFNEAYPGSKNEKIINATARAGFRNVRIASNYKNDSPYEREKLIVSRDLKEVGVSPTHTSVPCGGSTKDLFAVFQLGKTLARDFGNINGYTEFWNEPEAFGKPTAWNYAAAAKAFYLGIRAEHSNTKVLTASFLSPAYSDTALKSGLSEFFDAFTIHVYDPIEAYADKIRRYRKVLTKHGLEKCAIHITECNSYSEGISFIPGYYCQGVKFQTFEQEMNKADFLIKSQLSMQENGIAAVHSFALPILHEYEGKKDWGLVREDFSARPGLAAFSVLNALLAPAEYQGAYTPAPDVKGFLFQHTDGSQTLAYWWEGTGKQPSTMTLRQKNGSYCFRDLLGTPVVVNVKNGKLQLPLSNRTAYISGLKGLKPLSPALGLGERVYHTDQYDRSVIINLITKEGIKIAPNPMLAYPTKPQAKLEVQVWNMSEETKKGTVILQGAVKTVTSPELVLKPLSVEKFILDVEFALPAGEVFYDLTASGNFGEKPVSPAVIPICFPEATELRAISFAGTEKAENWRVGAAGPMRIINDAMENAVSFEATVPHPMNNWIYPRFDFPKGTLRGAIGFEFEMWVDEETIEKGYQFPQMYFNAFNMDYVPPSKTGWQTMRVYFTGIVSDPEEVTDIGIGFNTLNIGKLVVFKIRNMKILYPPK